MNSKQWQFYKDNGYFIQESFGTHKDKKVPNQYALVKKITGDRRMIICYLNRAAALAVVKRFGFFLIKDDVETCWLNYCPQLQFETQTKEPLIIFPQ